MMYYPAETKIEGTKILVKAKIWSRQESLSHWFHFDTGSDVIAIPREVLKRMEASKIRDVKVKGVIGGTEGELYSINIDCGGVRLEDVEVYASTEDYLLGMNFVLRAKVGFFFNGRQLIWVTS
jgi:predicted aspartyl protease